MQFGKYPKGALIKAKELTGYARKSHQEEWLKRHGFKYGKNWWEQRKGGDYIVWLSEERPSQPDIDLDLSSLGPEKTAATVPNYSFFEKKTSST